MFWLRFKLQWSSINYFCYGNSYVLYNYKSIFIEKDVSIKPRSYLSILEGASFRIGQGTNIGSDLVIGCVY